MQMHLSTHMGCYIRLYVAPLISSNGQSLLPDSNGHLSICENLIQERGKNEQNFYAWTKLSITNNEWHGNDFFYN
jgi:hypothetical protein